MSVIQNGPGNGLSLNDHNNVNKPTPMPASFNSSNGATSSNKRRKTRGMDLKYYEYNMTTMKDTKGGFLIDETPPNNTDQEKSQRQRKGVYESQPVEMNTGTMLRCKECDSMDIEYNYKKHYNVIICKSCIEKFPDKYSLLTKTECTTDYMLTSSELQDKDRLPTWAKRNPHKSTWSDMHLYLREQVEAFAIEKYGTLDKMDEVFQTREIKKTERKKQKANQKMKELRQKTRTSTWKKPEVAHVHTYEEEYYDEKTGYYTQVCTSCGMTTSFEAI